MTDFNLMLEQKIQFYIIMRESKFDDCAHLLFPLAQILKKKYLNTFSNFIFYLTLLVSQLTIMMLVIREFLHSSKLNTQLTVLIDQLSKYLMLSSQNPTTTARCFISILNVTTAISAVAIFLDKKRQLSKISFLQCYLCYALHILSALSVSFLYLFITDLSSTSQFIYEFQGPLDIINTIFILLVIYAVQWLSIDVVTQQSSQSIARIYKNNGGFIKICKILASWIFFLPYELQIDQFFIYLILIILHVTELTNLNRFRKYLNQFLQKMTEVISSIWIGSLLVMIIAHMFPLEIIANNIGSTFLTVNFLFYSSFTAFRDHKRRKDLFQGHQMIKNEEKAISYALELISFMKQSNNNENTIQRLFKSLSIQKHRNQCDKTMCICQTRSSFQNDSILLKIVTENILQEISQKFPYSFCLKFLILGFKLKNNPKIININLEINEFLKRKNVNNLSFQQRFIVVEMKKHIYDTIAKCKLKETEIKCENFFLEQSIKDKINSILNMIIVNMAEKHKLLMQDYYTLNSIQQFSLKINELICQMQDIWQSLYHIKSFNPQLYRLFIFYYQNVIPSHIQVKRITSQITKKLDTLDKLKHLKGFSKEITSKYVYSKKACVIQSNLEQYFGKVTNISKYCLEVLGWRKEQLINKDINQIMPQYFGKHHQQSMNQWLQNCSYSHYPTEMGQFGYVDAMQTSFQGFLMMRVLAGQNKLLFYSVLLRQNDNDYLLLNSQKEIQGIGKRLIKEEVFALQNIKHSISEYCDFNFDKKIILNQKFRGKIFLFNNHQQIISNSIQCMDNLQKSNKNMCKYQWIVSITKHKICKQFYYLIKFQNVTEWISSTKRFQQLRFGPKGMQNNKFANSLKIFDDQLMKIEQYESVQPITNNILFTQSQNITIKDSFISSNGFNQASYYNHFMKDVKNVLIDPNLLPLNFFKKVTILLFVLSACIVAQFFSLRSLFVVGFNSFNDVMFGDGAVSDNNQILQIMYNHVLMSRVYCQQQDQSARCRYLLNNTATISDILYNMYLDNVKVYLRNRTALSGFKFYASYGIEVPYYFGKEDNKEDISTMQFMEHYYGAVRKVCDEITAGRVKSFEADAAMNVLFRNWQTMKFVNHNAIYYYLAAGENELKMLRNYLLFLGASLVICIFTFAICLKRYKNFIVNQKTNIILIHTCMSKQLLRDLTVYYLYIKEVAYQLKFIPDKFEPTDKNLKYQNRKELKYKQSKLCLAQIIVIFLTITILGSMEILKISLVLPACMNMVQNINELMDSQNFLLQNYFEMKTFYLAYNFNKSVDQISQQIAVHLNQTQPQFTKISKESVDLFSADPTFTKDFNDLLIVDSCKLTAFLFQPWQVYYCINNFTTPILTLGLVSGMTFFQRNAYEALRELQAKQYQNINKTAYFMQDVFEDIDDSIFYMFRLYQATQTRMYQGLNHYVTSQLPLLDTINAFSTFILCFVMLWWLKSYRNQQKQVSQLYGMVLQFPQSIMKTFIITKIKRQLEINH